MQTKTRKTLFSIKTWNSISRAGLNQLPDEQYTVGSSVPEPHAYLVRSHKLSPDDIQQGVLAIARAGAGYNNIPLEECTGRGIVVFNTPGANANSVKELVIAGMLLSCRGIVEGMNWINTLEADQNLSSRVEQNKSAFSGTEISGKTLGIVGLGAIGALVANTAVDLGMKVLGFDPFISVNSAWNLSSQIKRCDSMEHILSRSDYVSIHVPLNAGSSGLVNFENLSHAKPGLRLLNFARAGLVDPDAVKSALLSGTLLKYITDFPTPELKSVPGVISIPHLGASTAEAEDNCAAMAVRQLKMFLETGAIVNSVNFPTCTLEPFDKTRLLIVNRNIPNMLTQILEVLSGEGLNVEEMVNRAHEDIAYNIIDISTTKLPTPIMTRLRTIDGVISTRQITRN